jgi:acyl-CoA-binding protein
MSHGMEVATEEADTEHAFEGAAVFVQSSLSQQSLKVSQETTLQLYALYKQATQGDASGSGPGVFSLDARAKAKWCG